MSEKTGIEWATHTASPWFGCSKVSAGCTNCYAEELTLRNGWAGWGDKSPRVRSKGFWAEAYRLNRKAEGVASRPRMFTSLMDWLDPMAPIEWLADFLKVIHDCRNLDWLLLTKRPELYTARLELAVAWMGTHRNHEGIWKPTWKWAAEWMMGKDPRNIWFGVTVENQAMADKRIPELLKIPARVRWLSVEPLLERVNLHFESYIPTLGEPKPPSVRGFWVVVGGESSRNRRDLPVESIIHVAEQCQLMGVPCFVKQDTHLKPGQQGRIPDEIWKLKEYPCQSPA